MGAPAIEVQGLWKQYRRGRAEIATSLRDEVAGFFRRPFAHDDAREEPFWALRDVSFSVNAGEVVGICGRNGAGKSTLLKILSRVVEPTRGRAILRGRVSSLLEVGTGFHGDLTGRENIFLNGSLLGLNHSEVRARLDAIVAFAEVASFLDTPVKHYSSGMQARLGFAVAAHLDQEILILDEVLAVGDAGFQRKCFATVHDAAQRGKTILFVSHSMSAVERFCGRAILLADGGVLDSGPPQQIAARYLDETAATIQDIPRHGDEIVVRGVEPRFHAAAEGPGGLVIEADVECLAAIPDLACGIGVYNSGGHLLANATARFQPLVAGPHRLRIEIADPGFPPGDFSLRLAAFRPGRWTKYFPSAGDFRVPITVTSDPFRLDQLDLAGIGLEVRRALATRMAPHG